jgi:hypothetical protein
MSFRQVDPSRLQGEALRGWYLRSPDEIEQERQSAQAQRYEAFVAGIRPASQAPYPDSQSARAMAPAAQANQPESLWVATGPNRWSSQLATSSDLRPGKAWGLRGSFAHETSDGGASRQLAANHGFCVACHGPGAEPPPPAMANPPNWPRWTPGPNTTPRKPSKPHPPQCALQNMNDSRICSREPGDAWKSVCLRSASDREAHCIASDGEVGWPPLQTHDRR